MSHLIRICDAIPKYCAADKDLDDTVNALDDCKEWLDFLEGSLNMEYNIYGQLSAMRPKRPPPPSAAPPHASEYGGGTEYSSSEGNGHSGDTFTPIFIRHHPQNWKQTLEGGILTIITTLPLPWRKHATIADKRKKIAVIVTRKARTR